MLFILGWRVGGHVSDSELLFSVAGGPSPGPGGLLPHNVGGRVALPPPSLGAAFNSNSWKEWG